VKSPAPTKVRSTKAPFINGILKDRENTREGQVVTNVDMRGGEKRLERLECT